MAMAATTLADRAVVRLSGEGVRDFLQGIVTNDVLGELPVWSGLLTPQGKCLADFLIWADRDDILLDCEAEAMDDLVKRLSMYRLRLPIRIEPDRALAVHWSKDGEEGVIDPRLPELGRRWLGPPGDECFGWLEHRLRLGVSEGVAELGDILWLECNAAELNGVSFTKGCFVGQENTARMNWRAKINRRLFVVEGRGDPARTRADYPDIGLAIVHARLDAIPANAIIPTWLQASITA